MPTTIAGPEPSERRSSRKSPPPVTQATLVRSGAKSQESSVSTCFASSRVGVTTSALGRAAPFGEDAVSPSTTARNVKPMATVLPEPVCELIRRSRPSSAGSSTASWTGVSVV